MHKFFKLFFLVLSLTLAVKVNAQITVSNTAVLLTLNPNSIRASSAIQTLGREVPGDGGAMLWRWEAGNTSTVNNIDIKASPIAPSAGRFVGAWDGDVRATLAKGDGVTDDQPALQEAFDRSIAKRIALLFPANTQYMIRTSLVARSHLRIRGDVSTEILKGFGSTAGPSLKPVGAIVTEGAVYPDWGQTLDVINTNISIVGLTVRGIDPFQGPLLYLAQFSDLEMSYVRIRSHENQDDWGLTLYGHYFRGSHLDIDTRGKIFNDGFHVLGGDDGVLINSVVWSGDDCLVLGNSRDQSIRRWNIANIIGGTTHGNAIRVALYTNTIAYPTNFPHITANVEYINFVNLTLAGGLHRNGLGLIEEAWPSWQTNPAPGKIRGIKVSNSYIYGGDMADHDGANPHGMHVTGCHDVHFDNCTFSNAIRSTVSAHGTIGFSADNCTIYPPQHPSGAYPAGEFRPIFGQTNLVNFDVSITGGTWMGRTNGSAIVSEYTQDFRVIGVKIFAGINGLAATEGVTNVLFMANQIERATNGINTVNARGFITSIGNQFNGVSNLYSGNLDTNLVGGVRLDYNLEIIRPDFGPLVTLKRGTIQTDFSVINSRFVIHNDAGVALANITTDDADKLSELLFIPYSHAVTGADTNANPFGISLRISSSQAAHVGNIGGSDSTHSAWTAGRLWAATNTTDLMGRNLAEWNPKGMTFNDAATPVVHDASVLRLVSATRGFQPPQLTTAAISAIVPDGIGLMAANSDRGRLESYTTDGWRSMVGGFYLPLQSTSAFTTTAGSYYFGATISPSTVMTNVAAISPKSGIIRSYHIRARAGALGSNEEIVGQLYVNGAAVGSLITNTFDSGSVPIYRISTETGLEIPITAGQTIAYRYVFPSMTTNIVNFTVMGGAYID